MAGGALPNVFELFAAREEWARGDWLVLGKGPSFSRFDGRTAEAFHLLTLNDVVREVASCAIAHFIDLDAFQRNAAYLAGCRCVVVMPWHPHVDSRAGPANLSQLCVQDAGLGALAAQGRLCWYDLATCEHRRGGFPALHALYFSAEAALDLLATAGVRRVRSLGLDGGSAYSARFSDLEAVSRLVNGRRNFDAQFRSFARILARTGVDYAPLDTPSPMRVFVAATASEALPVAVLRHSIVQHASASVDVHSLADAGIPIPMPAAPANRPRTPFSFQRFLVPQACGYQGQAIYLDSDMLVFKDIFELWRKPFEGAEVLTAYSDAASGRVPQFSVMLLDCARLDWRIDDIVGRLDAGTLSYEQLMYACTLAQHRAAIEPHWNALEAFVPGRTALLHYTDMDTQPWVSDLNPLGYLWLQALREAIAAGAVSRAFVEQEVVKGHVRPSLLYQLDHGLDDAILLPAHARALDAGFVAPYRALAAHRASPWNSRWLRARAHAHAHMRQWWVYRLRERVMRWLSER